MLTAAAMASPDSNMAPRSDSSASRLWGGTRPTLRWRRLASSMDCTMGLPTLTRAACGSLDRQPRDLPGEAWGQLAPLSTTEHVFDYGTWPTATPELLGDNLDVQAHLDFG